MSGRGGLPVKNIAYAVAALFLVYMMFIYHGAQNRLHEAEMTGARYKREADERVTEIQDLVKSHDKFQESCEKEKRELQNSINSVNTKYQMLESHQKDTEADLNTMKQHMETMKQEHSDAYTQHAQEYQSLKQEKDNEIARIKDDLADAQRKNTELTNTIDELRQQLQREEMKLSTCETSVNKPLGKAADARKLNLSTHVNLVGVKRPSVQKVTNETSSKVVDPGVKVSNVKLGQILVANDSSNDSVSAAVGSKNGREQLQAENSRLKQAVNAKQALPVGGGAVEQQQQQQQGQQQQGLFVPQQQQQGQGKMDGKFGANNVYDMKVDDSIKNKGVIHDSLIYDKENKPALPDNSLHQMRPPQLHPEDDMKEDTADKDRNNSNKDRAAVNPNDEQKAQIREPIIPNNKDGERKPDYFDNGDDTNNNIEEEGEDDQEDGGLIGGGGEAGAGKRNARDEEARREAGVLREEEQDNVEDGGHQNPLGLRQLEVPGNLDGADRKEVQEDEDEMNDRGGHGVGAGVGQQMPPAYKREAAEEDKFGERRNMNFRKAINPEAP